MDSSRYASQIESDIAELAGWFLGPLGVLPVLAFARWAIRLQTYKRFYEDDVALAVALVCSLSYGSVMYRSAVENLYLEFGTTRTDTNNPDVATATTDRIMQCVLFIGYAAVKFSFLFLYKELFWVSIAFRRLWWGVFAWLIVSTLAIVGFSLSTYGDIVVEAFGSGASSSYSLTPKLGYTKAAICQYIETIATLMLIGVPLWFFPSLHLRHSINWWITFVYMAAAAGWGLGISAAVFSFETMSPEMGSWALYWQVAAASFVGFTPMIIPEQRQCLWPWSKLSKKAKDVERSGGGSDSTSILENLKPKRRSFFGSMERLIERNSGGKLGSSVTSFSTIESIEMADFRSSLQDVRQQKVLRYSHAQGQGLAMEI